MKTYKALKLTAILATIILTVTACSNPSIEPGHIDTENVNESDETLKVEISHAHGLVMVPVNPKNVVALDNRTFETLSDWGIELAAAPKAIMPADIPYVNDDSVLDIGNHREPNLEIIAAVDPDLVIIGQRFASFYEDIKEIVPNAVIIDLDFDVSDTNSSTGDNLVNGMKNSMLSLGKIFDKNIEAKNLIDEFDKAIEEAKSAYNGRETILSVIVSGGNIGFSAPATGRVWGPMYEIFDWMPALEIEKASSDHQGDDISVEAIAQSNPDWIFVLDRDAGVSSTGEAVPAQDIIDNSPALKNTKAIKEKKIFYAPNDTYTNESIQTYIDLFNNLADSLGR